MSRHGYVDDYDCDNWDLICWRGMVASATRGERGQAMLRELLEALDAMPEKKLIRGDLVDPETGACCTIGALLVHREVPDPERYHEWNEELADELDVAEPLVQEIEFWNDEGGPYKETPEARWQRMRAWVAKQIKSPAGQGESDG